MLDVQIVHVNFRSCKISYPSKTLNCYTQEFLTSLFFFLIDAGIYNKNTMKKEKYMCKDIIKWFKGHNNALLNLKSNLKTKQKTYIIGNFLCSCKIALAYQRKCTIYNFQRKTHSCTVSGSFSETLLHYDFSASVVNITNNFRSRQP